MVWSVFTAVEPPVSNHAKYKDLVVAYGRWSLTKFSPRGSVCEEVLVLTNSPFNYLTQMLATRLSTVLVYVAHTLFKVKMLHILLFT